MLAASVLACAVAVVGAGSGFADRVAATGLDATQSGASAIVGTVSFDGGGLADVTVVALADVDPWPPAAVTTTDGVGGYELTSLASGDYRLMFGPPAGSGAASAWYDSATAMAGATVVAVDTPGDPVVVNQELPPAATISGTMADLWNDEEGFEFGGLVRAFRDGAWLPTATVEVAPDGPDSTDGTYTLDGLPAGTYRIEFTYELDESYKIRDWFDGSLLRHHSTPLTVAAGESLTGIDATFSWGGLLEVYVTTAEGIPIEGVFVAAYLDGAYFPAASGTTDDWGGILLEPIPRGPVRVFIDPREVSPDFHSEEPPRWYGGGALRSSGTPLPFDSINYTGITVELERVWETCEPDDPWCPYEDRCDLFPWTCEDDWL